MQKSTISVGISFPIEILKKIDKEREDIPRSQYVLRIIERAYLQNWKENKNCNDSFNFSFLKPVSRKSIIVGE